MLRSETDQKRTATRTRRIALLHGLRPNLQRVSEAALEAIVDVVDRALYAIQTVYVEPNEEEKAEIERRILTHIADSALWPLQFLNEHRFGEDDESMYEWLHYLTATAYFEQFARTMSLGFDFGITVCALADYNRED